MDLKEWHVCDKFSFKLGRRAAETFRVIEVASSEHVVWPQVFEWFSKLQIYVTSVEGIKCLGHTLTLILLTWRIWWAPNSSSKWQMGFNLAFKGLMSETGGSVDQLRELVLKNRRISRPCTKLPTCWGISFGWVQRVLKGNQTMSEFSF